MTGFSLIRYLKMPKKRERFCDIITIAKADGVITEEETAFMLYYAGQAGISAEEAFEMIKVHSTCESVNLKKANALEREQFLVDLVMMAYVDGRLSETEENRCREFAKIMGLSETMVNSYLEEMYSARKVLREQVEEWKKIFLTKMVA